MSVETTESLSSIVWLVEHGKEAAHEFVLLTLGGLAYVTLHSVHHHLMRFAKRLLSKRLRGGR